MVNMTSMPRPSGRRMAPSCVPSVTRARELAREMGIRLDGILISCQRARSHMKPAAISHLCAGPYPPGSFFCLGEDLELAGPVLTLLQASRALSDCAVVQLVSEFCGLFAPDFESELGLASCPPLLSLEELAGELKHIEAMRKAEGRRSPQGLLRLCRLGGYAVERAASPSETNLALLLALPVEWGGYGLPKPQMNMRVRLGGEFGDVVCDLGWEEAGLVMDYHGELVHAQSGRALSDTRKANALGHAGIELLEVRKRQLYSRDLTDELAWMVAERLGAELGLEDRGFRTAQLRLRRDLLGPWPNP